MEWILGRNEKKCVERKISYTYLSNDLSKWWVCAFYRKRNATSFSVNWQFGMFLAEWPNKMKIASWFRDGNKVFATDFSFNLEFEIPDLGMESLPERREMIFL